MTQQDYEQKKRECWENFKFARRPLNTDKKVFDYIFDRAYALGEQETAAEGEEMLSAEKSKVQTMYDNAIEIIANNPIGSEVHSMAMLTKELLRELFGEVGKGDASNVASNVASSEPYIDGFRSHNRLHIATQITASIYSNDKAASRLNSIEALVRKALDIADTLIAECELSTQSLCPAKKGGIK